MTHSRYHPLLAALAGIVLSMILSRALYAQQPPTPPPFDPDAIIAPDQPPSASRGRAIFQESCAPCHGQQGNSDGPVVPQLPAPPPPLADGNTLWERSPAEYFHITKFGRIQNLMPPWGNQLNDEQIWQAVYYAWSLHTDGQNVATGEDLVAAAEAAEPDAPADTPDFRDRATMIRLTPSAVADALRARFPTSSAQWSDGQMGNAIDYIYALTYAPPWESAYRAGAGILAGQLVQGTPDGEQVASLPVTLTAYIDFQPAATFDAVADAEGRFRFDNLDTSEGVVYIAETNYKEVRYGSEFIRLSPDQTETETTVHVFETTDDDSGLYISRANWVIDYDPGELIVGQILVLGNHLGRTFIGRQVEGVDVPVTTELVLPDGVAYVEFQDGELDGRYHRVGQRIYDTASVPPGNATRQIFMGYRLPYEGDSVEFTQPFQYTLEGVDFLVAELPNLEANVTTLSFISTDTIQGVTYQLWGGQNLPAAPVRVQLSGLIPAGGVDPRQSVTQSGAPAQPPAANLSPLAQTVPLAMGGVFLLLLGGVLGWFAMQRRTIDPAQALQEQQQELIARIAQLDDRRARGELNEETWSHQRAMLKSQLLTVAGQLRSNPST